MEPADVPDEALAGAALVHLTGITTALGDGPRALVVDVARRAREAGAIVTFDPNYCPALWDGPQAAAAAMAPVLEHVSWFLCGAAEGEALLGEDVPAALTERGVGGSVVRTAGSALVTAGGASWDVAPTGRETVVDEIGAGDAFAAGFLSAHLDGLGAQKCLERAHALAAMVCMTHGDWEGLPTREQLHRFTQNDPRR
jgi:2-dehydro-3-deoxygluconokinase